MALIKAKLKNTEKMLLTDGKGWNLDIQLEAYSSVTKIKLLVYNPLVVQNKYSFEWKEIHKTDKETQVSIRAFVLGSGTSDPNVFLKYSLTYYYETA